LAQFCLSDEPVVDMASEARGDASIRRAIDLELIPRSIFLNPMLTKIYVSLAHDQAAVDTYLEALAEVVAELM
jgi:glutamate-1-semialdehyde 2,1-aminomutase